MPKGRLSFLAVLLLLTTVCKGQNRVKDFFSRYLPLSTELSAQYGIPVSIILGVSFEESGFGTSRNCKLLNNFFGVRGRNTLKKSHSTYKQYNSPEDSFRDFCNILTRKKFYSKLKNDMNSAKWIDAMDKANYASGQAIWKKETTIIIKKYRLSQYDTK